MFGCQSLKSLCNHAAVHQSCKKTCNKCQGNASQFDIFPGGATQLRHNHDVSVTYDDISNAEVRVFCQKVHEIRI